MTPEQAWQAALDHLKLEMPKATFEKWVRDTRFLAFEGGCYSLGVTNTYIRDWLQSRLTSTLKRFLTGTLNHDVEIEYVVLPLPSNDSPGEEPPQPEITPQTRSAAPSISAESVEMLIQPIRVSLYEIITRPRSVVVVPAYFLRWLPYLGPARGWFLVAMRQAFYQAYSKKLVPRNCGQTFAVNRAQLAQWAGMGERLVRQLMKEVDSPDQTGNFLAWFMQAEKSAPGKPTQYTFRADMPLTPADAEDLRAWLMTNGIQQNPLATLKVALEKQPYELLRYPAPPFVKEYRALRLKPLTVQEVIFASARMSVTDSSYLPLKKLADELHNHLQSPADNLVLTHYFLLEWVQKLGHTAAWAITILRDRGYFNHQTGVRRDRIKLAGGYGELAQLLNVSERQIRDCLPALAEMCHSRTKEEGGAELKTTWEKRQTKRKLTRYFLEKSGDIGWSHSRITTYEFKVKLEDPLTPEHQVIYEELGGYLHEVQRTANPAALETLIKTLDEQELENRYANDPGNQEDETRLIQPATPPVRARSTPEDAIDPTQVPFGTRVIHLKALINKHLYEKARCEINLLLQQHLAEFHQRIEEPTDSHSRKWGRERVWNWEKLLGYGSLPPEVRRQILQNPANQTQFLAQVLYGFENKASGTHTGIKAPFKFAAKYWHESPLPEYMELARLSPCQLAVALEDWQGRATAARLSDSARHVIHALRENDFLRILEDATLEASTIRLTQPALKKVN